MYHDTFKPKVFDDVAIYPLYKDKEGCIGTIEGDSFIKVRTGAAADTLTILKMMNGERSVSDLQEVFTNSEISIDVQALLIKLSEAGLLENSDIKKKTEISRLVKPVFSIKFSNKLKLFNVFSYFPEMCFVVALVLMGYNVYQGYVTGFSWLDLVTADISVSRSLYYYFGMILFMFLHEFSHLCIMRRYGLPHLEFSMGLHFFIFPVFFVRGKGMYTLSKSKRIKILLAGVVLNFLLMAAFLTVYLQTGITILLDLSFFNLQSVLINLMPFAFRDGYYVLANILNKVNLRDKYLVTIARFPRLNLFMRYDWVEKIYTVLAICSMFSFCLYQARNVLNFLNINLAYVPFAFILTFGISITTIKVRYKAMA